MKGGSRMGKGDNKTVEIPIDGILNMTDKSVCVDIGNGRFNGVWIPISQIEGLAGLTDEEFGEWCAETKEIRIPEWLAVQRGLV